MDKKTMSRLREIKRRSFFSSLFKGTIAFFIINSFPFRFLSAAVKREKSVKIEMNPLAIKRNKRG